MRVLIDFLIEDNVFWFEISMNNTHLVYVIDTCHNLPQDLFFEVLGEMAVVHA
jgi:hypothetical protein